MKFNTPLFITFITLISAPLAHAERPKWDVGLLGTSTLAINGESDGVGSGGASLQARYWIFSGYALGLRLDGQWLLPSEGSYESNIQQQSLLLTNRIALNHGFSIDADLGVVRYAALFDSPGSEDCIGCGRYDGDSYSPTLLVGAVYHYSINETIQIEAAIRLGSVLRLFTMTDVHNFLPASTTIGADLGMKFSF